MEVKTDSSNAVVRRELKEEAQGFGLGICQESTYSTDYSCATQCCLFSSRVTGCSQQSIQVELVRMDSCPLTDIAFSELRRNIITKLCDRPGLIGLT